MHLKRLGSALATSGPKLKKQEAIARFWE